MRGTTPALAWKWSATRSPVSPARSKTANKLQRTPDNFARHTRRTRMRTNRFAADSERSVGVVRGAVVGDERARRAPVREDDRADALSRRERPSLRSGGE